MDILPHRRDIKEIQQEIEILQKRLQSLSVEREALQADFDGYDSPEYEHFKEHVLEKEKVRLAFERMNITASDQVLHEQIQGQFNECNLLGRKQEDIERRLVVNQFKVSDSNTRIEKLKKQLKNRTERYT